jgi:hypothetical protein
MPPNIGMETESKALKFKKPATSRVMSVSKKHSCGLLRERKRSEIITNRNPITRDTSGKKKFRLPMVLLIEEDIKGR